MAKKNDFREWLDGSREIRVTVIGRRTGREISFPVGFVFEAPNLYLLPFRGSDTQWYRNILENPSLTIEAQSTRAQFQAAPIKEEESVKSVIEKFCEKYGENEIRKYHSKFDVAVIAKPRHDESRADIPPPVTDAHGRIS